MTQGINAPRRSLLTALLGLCALCACALPEFAHAQAAGFPSRPITIVVPYPPGGTTDVLARTLQEPLQRFLGQPVIVENKPGAAAVLGAKFVANAPGDGYTLLFPNNGLVISPQISKEANYDALKDFAPVSLVSLQPMILMTQPGRAGDQCARAHRPCEGQSRKLEYATAGPASFGHLATELFSQQAGIQMVARALQGPGADHAGHPHRRVEGAAEHHSSQMNAFIKEGKVRMLGVASKKASPLAPGAAPIAETLPGFEAEVWFGLVAPKGTPPPVIAKLNDAVVKALALPEVQQKFEIAGAAATGSTPAEFARRIADEYGTWTAVIRDAKIEAK